MQTKYSKEFKIEAVKKVLLRDRDASIASVARSIGITKSTLYLWIKVMANADSKEVPTSGEGIQKNSYKLINIFDGFCLFFRKFCTIRLYIETCKCVCIRSCSK